MAKRALPKRPARPAMDSDSESDFSMEESSASSPSDSSSTAPVVQMRRSKRGQSMPQDLSMVDDPEASIVETESKPGKKDSLRDRMQFLFSTNEPRLVQAVQDRVAWGHIPFAPDPSSFRSLAPLELAIPRFLSQLRLNGAPQPPAGAHLAFEDASLPPGLTRQAERIVLANFGNPVSTVAWAPSHENEEQLLAVGVVYDPATPPLNRNAVSPDLAVFADASETDSVFYIYSFNPKSEILEIHSSITSKFGTVLSMAWQPGLNSKVLAVVFQQGQLGIVHVDQPGSFEINSTISLESKITCCAWRSPSVVVVGTHTGDLAEFDLDDGTTPSFVYNLAQSPITTLSTSYPEYPEFVFCSAMDGYSRIIDVRDIRHVRATVSQRARTFYTQSAWSPFVDSFVSCDDILTSRLVPLRHSDANLVGLNLTRHLSSITALAASPVHPMVLSGGLDGSVHIVNGLSRAMVVRRIAKPPNEAVVWTLECSEASSTYRFTENLVSQPLGKPPAASEKLFLFPKTCTITSLDWIPAKAYGGWYAAGTASGLLRIENLAQ